MRDDPRLTAHTFDELDPHERAEVDAWLARDAEAAAELEAIDGVATLLAEAFAREDEVRASSRERPSAGWLSRLRPAPVVFGVLAIAAVALLALAIERAAPAPAKRAEGQKAHVEDPLVHEGLEAPALAAQEVAGSERSEDAPPSAEGPLIRAQESQPAILLE